MRREDDGEIERVAAELRQPVHFDESLDARVMESVRALPRHRFGSWIRVLRPRTVTVSPVVSGIAAAVLFAATLSTGHAIGVARGGRDAVSEPTNAVSRGAVAGTLQRDVQFVLVAPTARKVTVVGDFNDWDSSHAAFQAEHRGGGVWSVTAPVPVGHHRYSFVVDDSLWVSDPAAPRALDDDYGMPNSALVVARETGG